MTRQRQGELVKVKASGEYRFENPYKATIAFNYDSVEVTGRVRIEPPLELSDDYLEGLKYDLRGGFVLQMLGKSASLYDFSCDPNVVYDMTPEARVVASLQRVIDEAGALVSDNILGLEATDDLRDD